MSHSAWLHLIGASMQGDCPTPGCTGIGHVKGAKYTGHHRCVCILFGLAPLTAIYIYQVLSNVLL